MSDLQLNCITFLFGSVIYFISYGYVRENAQTFVGRMIKDWGIYIWLCDVVTMAILYRSHYGRSILSEGLDDPEKWTWNDQTNQYQRTDLDKKEEFYDKKFKDIERAADMAEEFEEALQDLDEQKKEVTEKVLSRLDKIDKIEQDVQELDMAIRYAPGGEMMQMAQTDFEERAGNI